MLYLSEIKYDGKSYAELGIKKGMKMDELICLLINTTLQIDKALKFDCLDYKALGLDRCDTDAMSPEKRMCTIINQIIAQQTSFNKSLATLSKLGAGGSVAGIDATDSLVKISKTDAVAGYLQNKIVSNQSDVITVITGATGQPDSLQLTGFIPIGGVIMIDSNRITAFDNTGKGKPKTDCSIFAICNGNNGTRNRLGRFPRWAAEVAKAGAIGGTDQFTVKLSNLEAFDLDINLDTTQFDATAANFPNIIERDIPIGSSTGMTTNVKVAGIASGSTNSNYSHSHKVQGKIPYKPNPNAIEKIAMLPLYIDELPIQRII